jgi:2-keto-4-pentenoate hydratase/2-oxohepta-3-ene-1,7-dioic acid hydratase in catechol pathway
VTTVLDKWEEMFSRREPKILCIGLNYRAHVVEGGQVVPTSPIVFGKFSNALCGDGDPIVLPKGAGHVDAEAELAVVIGQRARNVPRGKAFDVVAGYCCANDVSDRDAQESDGQWFRGKGHDTFCPVGPAITEIADPSNLRIVQRLNGHVLQDSHTSRMIFDVPTLVEYVSRIVTLDPGDLILTGTPEGVGLLRAPQIALTPGDVVEVEVEGIGVLSNPVVAGR